MNSTPAPLRIPETMGLEEIGPYMRSIREHFKLTPQDVSERIHIRVRYVTAMEECKLDAMPGKVYARGYIHTYAEFLGLDADQVAQQYFSDPTKAVPGQPIKPTPTRYEPPKPLPSTTPVPSSGGEGWRGLLLPVLVILAGAFFYSQYIQDNDEEEAQEVVQPVQQQVAPAPAAAQPEALLSPVYDTVMPNARSYNCMMGDLYLSCFFADATLDKMASLSRSSDLASLVFPAKPVKRPAVNLRDTSEYERAE